MVGMGSIVFHVIQRIELTVKSDAPSLGRIDVQSDFNLADNGYFRSASIAALKLFIAANFSSAGASSFNLNNTMCFTITLPFK